jgi:hypothetical protein
MNADEVILDFDPQNFEGNVMRLVEHFGYRQAADNPVARFLIDRPGHPEEEVKEVVREGKYKSAILLYYLYTLVVPLADDSKFLMNERLRGIARAYFGDEICQDAISNKGTKHKTVRALLCGPVFVHLVFDPKHKR